MSLKFSRRLLLLGLVLGCCLVSTPILADKVSDLEKQIEAEERAKKEAEEAAAQLVTLTQEANQELETTNAELDTIVAELTDLATRAAEAQEQLTYYTELQEETEALIEEQKVSMRLRIQYMYENQSVSFWELLAGSASLGEVLNGTEYINSLTRYDKKLLDDFKTNLQTVKECKAEAETRQAELETLLAETEERRASYAEKSNALADKLEDYAARLAELKEKAQIADASLDKLAGDLAEAKEAARRAAEAAAREASRKASDARGVGSTDIDGSWINPSGYTNLELLAAIIDCEGGGQPRNGMIAIGNVIYNRIADRRFQTTIYDVIYGPNQFTPAMTGSLDIVLARGARARCVEAAQACLDGERAIGSQYLYFCSLKSWNTVPKRYKAYLQIGGHIFYYN